VRDEQGFVGERPAGIQAAQVELSGAESSGFGLCELRDGGSVGPGQLAARQGGFYLLAGGCRAGGAFGQGGGKQGSFLEVGGVCQPG